MCGVGFFFFFFFFWGGGGVGVFGVGVFFVCGFFFLTEMLSKLKQIIKRVLREFKL